MTYDDAVVDDADVLVVLKSLSLVYGRFSSGVCC